jgi:DNA-binding transcriptional regulator LsrR (DeoR family)
LDTSEELLVRIAWLYYKDQLTQAEIAHKFDISRVKVSRLLTEARERRLVEINIPAAANLQLDRERELRTLFHLHDVTIVPSSRQGDELRRVLAQRAATYFQSIVHEDLRVGLGMGRTLSYLPDFFRSNNNSFGCTFVEMVGGTARTSTGFDTYNISWKMAQLCTGEAEHVTTPVVVDTPSVREILMKDRSIASVIDHAAQVNVALLGVGVVDDDCTLLQMGYLDARGLKQLRALGAVGDILGRFYDREGHLVPHDINKRVIGIELAHLRKIPLVVAIAGGLQKTGAILGALRGGYVKVLITDHETACAVLEMATKEA